MKTSFYFVLWIIIYPLLSLFNNAYIAEHSFVFALVLIFGMSYLINNLMPQPLTYEKEYDNSQILENVYTGNVRAILKRVRKNTCVEAIFSLYFLVTTGVIAYIIFTVGINDWIALIVFGFFTFGSISRFIRLSKGLKGVKSNSTPEQCVGAVEEVYDLDYTTYYEDRQSFTYDQLLPQRPRHYKAFQIVSIIFAAICTLLGLLTIVGAVLIAILYDSLPMYSLACVNLLYGSLATYYGIIDFASILQSLRRKSPTKAPAPQKP